MDDTADDPCAWSRADPSMVLLTHCLALGATVEERPPARVRLEAELGPDLARRLLASLTRPETG